MCGFFLMFSFAFCLCVMSMLSPFVPVPPPFVFIFSPAKFTSQMSFLCFDECLNIWFGDNVCGFFLLCSCAFCLKMVSRRFVFVPTF